MHAGHGGATGRMKRHRETAFDYAFSLDLTGIGTSLRQLEMNTIQYLHSYSV
jgi:hypothetical protein